MHSWLSLGSVALFCSATGSQLTVSKSRGFLIQAQLSCETCSGMLCQASACLTGQQTVKHLGVRLGYDLPTTCPQTFTAIKLCALKAKVTHWAARG